MKSLNRRLFAVLTCAFLLSALVLTGCGSNQEPPAPTEKPSEEQTSTETTETESQEETLYTPEYKPNGEEVAVIKTSKGEITVELYGKDAPIHVGNFVELARKGFYDDLKFHRFVPNFVIQGGDPQTKDLSGEKVAEIVAKQEAGQYDPADPALGTGGPGYFIKGEFDAQVNPNKHVEGALGMARSQMPDSAGSQFYFALQALPQLDGGYTVFGKITKGLDVVKQLRAGDVIESVEIQNAD